MKTALFKNIIYNIFIACCLLSVNSHSQASNKLFVLEFVQANNNKFKNEISVNNDIISMYKSTTYSSDVLQNDYGVYLGLKSIEVFTAPQNGTAHFKNDNKLFYTPDKYFVGDDYLEYKVCDIENRCGVAGVIIHVLDYDYKPQAIDDSVSIKQNQHTKIDVLKNDLYLYDLEISLELLSTLRYGSAKVTNDNQIEVFIKDFYLGNDSLQYKVCDGDGDCDTAFLNIRLSNKFDISNTTEGFSPNGDGINDTFTIPALDQYLPLEIEIIDRNGRAVYNSMNYDNNWDGNGNQGEYDGLNCPSGIYYYKINIKEIKERITGYIYLNR